jgi:hypothetical protein
VEVEGSWGQPRLVLRSLGEAESEAVPQKKAGAKAPAFAQLYEHLPDYEQPVRPPFALFQLQVIPVPLACVEVPVNDVAAAVMPSVTPFDTA